MQDTNFIEKNSNAIDCIYEEINNPQIENIEKIDPFYLSEEQLKQRVKLFNDNYMNKVAENLDIYEWFKKLSYLYSYAEYLKNIDTSQNIESRHINLWASEIKTEEMKKFYSIIQNKILYYYYEKLFKELKDDFNNKNYNEDKYNKFINILNENNDIILNLRQDLYEEDYFIPNLNEELDEKIWGYTHNIWSTMRFINDKSDFIKVIRKRLNNASALGKYRLESLNEQYGINI